METTGDFGKWLKEVREDMGLNQSQMAELVGYDQSHLSKVERGEKAATEGLCVALAKAIGLPPTRALIAFLDTDDQEAACIISS